MKVLITDAIRRPVLAMIRELDRAGYTVVGADERIVPFGLYSRHARLVHLDSRRHEDGYAGALLEVVRREKPDLLIPYTDVMRMSELKERLEEYTRVLAPDPGKVIKAHNKKITLEDCGRLGIAHPAVYTEDEALDRLSGNGKSGPPEPLVVKPVLNIGGGQGLSVVSDPQSLKAAKEAVEKQYGEAIIQEYIPGGVHALRSAGLLFGKGGRLVAFFTLKKLRCYPRFGGVAVLAVSTHEADLVKTALPLFRKWEWEGPAEIDYKIDPRDGRAKLLEVNPRFWGTVEFPIRCGVNFPLLACRMALDGGKSDFPIPHYPADLKFVHPSFYWYSTLDEMMTEKHKLRVLRSALSDLKGKKVGHPIGLSDPAVMVSKLFLDFKSILFPDE
jgi:predicted ATP-grasp superfamily ATP-dependent carboligase